MKREIPAIIALGLVFALLVCSQCAQGIDNAFVRFEVRDRLNQEVVRDAQVELEAITGSRATMRFYTLRIDVNSRRQTLPFDLQEWHTVTLPSLKPVAVRNIAITLGDTILLKTQGQPPIRDIYIKVTARIIPKHANAVSPGSTVDRNKIKQLTGAAGGSVASLIKEQQGVASDSAGQQHVRGEHADIAYIVDGIPLPDTLSGRQGSIVVPNTIERLEFLTGGFPAEFGGQTAAVLNITTLPGKRQTQTDIGLVMGSYDTTNFDLTTSGSWGKVATYVLDIGANRTRNYLESQQPDTLTAHNEGASLNEFFKMCYTPGKHDVLSVTLSRNPNSYQINNRTGLPNSFASAGQGYGFLGLRNADGTIPESNRENPGGLGSETLLLRSQHAANMDITAREVSEFATLSWKRELSANSSALFALTLLHAGQDLQNHNPGVDLFHLPTDNSIEYNPTSARNIHHVQLNASFSVKRGRHEFKAGLMTDEQEGNETYQLLPASQLALDTLANLAPNLAPRGSVKMDATNQPVLDVNGNAVYVPTSGSPTLSVHRTGFYRAGFVQDTWKVSKRVTANIGLRADWYSQKQDLSQGITNTAFLSPRLNFSYALSRQTNLRWSYNRLFNTPPLAQGAIVGQAIQPETLDQYDVSVEHQLAPRQSVSLAYYVKQIRNQVDTGLLIPGSQIGLYSAINLQYGAVHGIEFVYDLAAKKDKQNRSIGFDVSFNFTHSIAAPNGLDNTGAPVPDYNDHDQRNAFGADIVYNWKSGATASLVVSHGSGLASSSVPPSTNRIPRTQIDLHLNTGQNLFHKKISLGLDILNVLDDRTVINFQSAFSGTRFQQGRMFQLSLSGKF